MTAKTELKKERQIWMALLAGARSARLEQEMKNLQEPFSTAYIVRPETGMIMVQAKADGAQSRFNLGEVTVSRCILEVNDRYLGAAWVMGADLRHAELAAVFDGLLQDPAYHHTIYDRLIRTLEKDRLTDRQMLKQDASDTRVEFFTMKRGE